MCQRRKLDIARVKQDSCGLQDRLDSFHTRKFVRDAQCSMLNNRSLNKRAVWFWTRV